MMHLFKQFLFSMSGTFGHKTAAFYKEGETASVYHYPDRPSRDRVVCRRKYARFLLTISWVLAFAATACGQSDTSRTEIKPWILEQGGEFDVDLSLPGEPVVAVRLDCTRGIDRGFTPDSLVDRDLKRLNGLPYLQSLTLENRTELTAAGLRYVSGIESLVELDLSGTSLKGLGLGYLGSLSQLQTLNLSRCHWLTDDAAKYLEQLKQVRCLRLDATSNHWAHNDHWRSSIQVSTDSLFWRERMESALGDLRGGISDAGLSHVAKLDLLQELSLVMTRVSDAGVQQLAELHHLERLDLSRTGITDEALKHVAKLKRLKSLQLNYVCISDEGLKQIAKLPALEELELRVTNISPDGIRHLRELRSLRKLDLSLNRMNEKTVEALENFPNLQELDINGYRHSFSDLVTFANANQQMDLKQALVASGLGRVDRKNHLVHLILFGQQLLREDDLVLLRQFEHLESLNFGESNLSDTGLRHFTGLTKLKYLNLVGTLVTDDGLRQLSGLTNLETLPIRNSDLSFTATTDMLIEGQQQSLPDALQITEALVPPVRLPQGESEFLDLRDFRLNEADLATISQYQPARTLFLPAMQISDQGFSYLGELHSLERLWLAGGKITRQRMSRLASLLNLEELFLTDCELEADALASLGDSLPRLRVLNFSGSLRNDAELESLGELSCLQILIVDSGSLSDVTINNWRDTHPGVEVLLTQRLALEAIRKRERQLDRLPEGSRGVNEMGLVSTRVAESELNEIYGDAFSELAKSISISDGIREVAIASLPRLRTIESAHVVAVRNIKGIVPALVQLPSLKQMSFYRASIRDDDLADLSEFRQLESLDLQETRVTDAGLIHLRNLSKLKTLRLGGYGTEIRDKGIRYLATLNNLEELNLDHTGITDNALAHLRGLHKLKSLSLRNVLVDQGLVHLADLGSLTQLDLDSTFLSDATVEAFRPFPEMFRLSADGTMLTEVGVRRLQSLVPSGSFRAPRLMSPETHAAMVPLAGLRVGYYRDSEARVYMVDLRELENIEPALPSVSQLSGTLRELRIGHHANDDLVFCLMGFPNIETLDLSDGSVTTAGLLRLSEMKNLRTLHLRRYSLTTADLEALGKMTQLEVLNLYGCQLPETGLAPLGSLSNVRRLYLSNSNVRDADLQVISTLASLEFLALGNTSVSALGLTSLQGSPTLNSLYLRGTVIEQDQSALKQLQELIPECSINVGQ